MPRVVDHEQRRLELIEATWTVIAKGGFDAVTMRAVAAEAGCTTGRITHYFTDRDDLLIAALRRAHDAAGLRMAKALAAATDPRQRLRQVLVHALPLDPRSVAEWKVWIAFWSLATSDRRLAREDARRYAEWSALLAETLHGLVPPRHVASTVSILMAAVDGMGIRGAVHPGTSTRREIEARLDVLLDTLGLS
jgi:AcrR family transcriptional regulator